MKSKLLNVGYRFMAIDSSEGHKNRLEKKNRFKKKKIVILTSGPLPDYSIMYHVTTYTRTIRCLVCDGDSQLMSCELAFVRILYCAPSMFIWL